MSHEFVGIFLRAVRRRGRKKKPLYRRRLPPVRYSETVREQIKAGYQMSGSIDGMLVFVAGKTKTRKAKKHFQAARSYLKESHYKDYETALYSYAGDGSAEVRQIFEEIIRTEIRKKQGLPLK